MIVFVWSDYYNDYVAKQFTSRALAVFTARKYGTVVFGL